MIDAEWARAMARYNRWMNERLYALCAGLEDAERRRDRGAFFGSIHATLDHVLYGDLAWMSRFTGEPAAMPRLGTPIHDDFDALRTARVALDRRIEHWAAGLEPDWLAGTLRFTSQTDGRERAFPRWLLVTHLFNHQTHHRGQLTTLLTQIGLDPGDTCLHKGPPLSDGPVAPE